MSIYQRELKRKRDNYSREEYVLKHGMEQGMEQGIQKGVVIGEAKGEAKGRHEEALEIASKMKKEQFPIEQIAKLTKLTIEEIQAL